MLDGARLMAQKPARLLLVAMFALSACASVPAGQAESSALDSGTSSTLEVAAAFLQAAGTGDMTTLQRLMADDFVWHNEGDRQLPWIGTWEGKSTVLEKFLPAFGSGLRATTWTTDFQFANGDQAVFMGTMAATATNTGQSTGLMSWAVRVHVEEGRVKRWTWFEDSFAVSQAYGGRAE